MLAEWLRVEPPFDPGFVLAYLAARAIPGVEQVDGATYERTLAVGGLSGVMTLDFSEFRKERLRLSCSESLPAVPVREAAIHLTGASAKVAEAERTLAGVPELSTHVRRHSGLRIPGTVDGFELAVRAVLGQQVSIAAARTLAARVARRWGRLHNLHDHPTLALLFPSPGQLADAELEAAGVASLRASAIRELARRTAEDPLWLHPTADPDAVHASLLSIRGVGPWTAGYITLRATGHADALVAGDLGLRQMLGSARTPISARELNSAAERWRPYRGYASLFLWAGWATAYAPSGPSSED